MGVQEDLGNINEFAAHPDYRQVAAFFLGGVFIISLNYSFLWIRDASFRFGGPVFPTRFAIDVEQAKTFKARKITLPARENVMLVFTLSICFLFASVAYFASLLSFRPDGGAVCSFVIAWGGMAAQTTRLVGLVILLLEIQNIGTSRLELFAYAAGLLLGIASIFVNNALSTGTTRVFKPLGVALCYRNHFLPTSLVSSLIFFILEVYTVARLLVTIAPRRSTSESRLACIKDTRILKALSLIFLELLTVVPSAIYTNILSEFIPLSVGAIVVLTAFNSRRDNINRNLVSESRTSKVEPPVWAYRKSATRSSHTSTRSELSSIYGLPLATTAPHPFSAQSLSDHKLQSRTWSQLDLSPQSNLSSPQSIQEGIVLVAERRNPYLQLQPIQRPPVPAAPPESYTPVDGLTFPSLLLSSSHENRLSDSSVTLPYDFPLPPSTSVSSKTTASIPSSSMNDSSNRTHRAPPIPSALPSPSHLRRYSSATLTSLASIRTPHGGLAGHRPSSRRVRLLNFESTFRTNDSKSSGGNDPEPTSTIPSSSRDPYKAPPVLPLLDFH